jgi:hypothetical protein
VLCMASRGKCADRLLTADRPEVHRPEGNQQATAASVSRMGPASPTTEGPGRRDLRDRPLGGPADPASGRSRLVLPRVRSGQQASSAKEDVMDEPMQGAVQRGEVRAGPAVAGSGRDRPDQGPGTDRGPGPGRGLPPRQWGHGRHGEGGRRGAMVIRIPRGQPMAGAGAAAGSDGRLGPVRSTCCASPPPRGSSSPGSRSPSNRTSPHSPRCC